MFIINIISPSNKKSMIKVCNAVVAAADIKPPEHCINPEHKISTLMLTNFLFNTNDYVCRKTFSNKRFGIRWLVFGTCVEHKINSAITK